MALYPKAIKKLIPPGATDPKIKPRVAILHIAVFIGLSLYDYFANRSGGVESHFYIRFDGTVEQYRDTDYEADANWHANPFAVSIETEGKAEGEWTAAQMLAIKELLLWLNGTHDIPLVKCPEWDGAGVGYHNLFSDEWAGGPRACPGPDRIKQFNDVLVRWMSDPKEIDVAEPVDIWSYPSDVEGVTMWRRLVDAAKASGESTALKIWGYPSDQEGVTMWRRVVDSAAATAQIAALSAAVTALAETKEVDAAAIQAQIATAVDAALADLSVTLSTQETPSA